MLFPWLVDCLLSWLSSGGLVAFPLTLLSSLLGPCTLNHPRTESRRLELSYGLLVKYTIVKKAFDLASNSRKFWLRNSDILTKIAGSLARVYFATEHGCDMSRFMPVNSRVSL